MRFIIRCLFAMTLVPLSHAALALGLGDAEVNSFLNQPLDVRIRLISDSAAELEPVTAALASADDFAVVGLSRAAISVPLTFEVNRELADPHLRITSGLPVRDPVVQLVIEVNFSAGRMLRQYTLFLDPPTVPAQAPAVSAPIAPPSAPAPARAQPPAVVPDAEPLAPARVVEPVGGEMEYGPVQSGETLWDIAIDHVRGTDVTVNQAMNAIFRENPQAFIRDNMNLLKRGAILRVPGFEDMRDFDRREAMLEAIRQREEFRSDRAPQPAEVEVPEVADTEPEELPEPVAEVAPVEPVVEPAPEPEVEAGRLELVPPAELAREEDAEAQGPPGEEARPGEFSQRLARVEEALENARQENVYLAERIRELEDELAVRREATAVADAGMAEMEERLRAERLAEAEAEEPEPAQPRVRPDTPWYAGLKFWIALGLLLVVGLMVWAVRRRRAAEGFETEASAVEDSTPGPGATEAVAPKPMAPVPVEAPPRAEKPAAVGDREQHRSLPLKVEEAVELDKDDPNTMLDLARAYLAMGDKSAARAILEDVLRHGNPTQVAEARNMLGEV